MRRPRGRRFALWPTFGPPVARRLIGIVEFDLWDMAHGPLRRPPVSLGTGCIWNVAQVASNQSELPLRGLQVLSDFLRKNLRRRQVPLSAKDSSRGQKMSRLALPRDTNSAWPQAHQRLSGRRELQVGSKLYRLAGLLKVHELLRVRTPQGVAVAAGSSPSHWRCWRALARNVVMSAR